MTKFFGIRANRTDDWRTPKELYESLNEEFHFTDDPCPIGAIKDADGLLREWGTSTYMNPPYSEASKWCEKALIESRKGKIVVGLLKGDTSTRWFHEFVLPFAEIRFIRGRIRFNGLYNAPFPSIIAIWRGA